MMGVTFQTHLNASDRVARALRKHHSPYYSEVPKTVEANAAYRASVYEECKTEAGARDVWCIASRDILWAFNVLAWSYNPRKIEANESPEFPWITWDFQDESILQMAHHFGREDLVSRKSRQMGWTWMMVGAFWWHWMFRNLYSMLMVSRTEDLVDKPGDRDALFWRFEYLTDHLPEKLRPPVERSKLHIENLATRSVLDGAATTANIARGGVRTAIGIDEFAAFSVKMGIEVLGATQAATNCRIVNSTHKGGGTAFAKLCDSPVRKLTTMWWQHPERRVGLYSSEDGQVKKMDSGYEFPFCKETQQECSFIGLNRAGEKRYVPFKLDGKIRSPWYDRESQERLLGIPRLIAQELDCDVKGSATQFFEDVPQVHRAKHCRAPLRVGSLVFDANSGDPDEFVRDMHGALWLWFVPDATGRPPRVPMVLASDVGAGSGASDSTHVAYRIDTREKVLGFRSNELSPRQHANLGVALCRWLGNAYHIWDATGPTGALYTRRVQELAYENYFYRYANEHTDHKKATDQPGFQYASGRSSQALKGMILGAYKDALSLGTIINYDSRALEECDEIVIADTGDIVHTAAVSATDPRAAKTNHGDFVTADSLANRAFEEVAEYEAEPIPETPGFGSVRWLRAQVAASAMPEATAMRF